MKIRLLYFFLSLVLLICSSCEKRFDADICIYGGTSAGIIAAYSAAQLGKTVMLIEPSNHLGGLTTGGLGQTDIGNKQAVTGLSRQFYRKIGQHYGRLEQWTFEPRVADSIMQCYLDHDLITVITDMRLMDVICPGLKIESAGFKNGKGNMRVSAKYFIDATYEGDLLSAAGVSYTIGRESNDTYGETWNGVQMQHLHQFPDGVDPYKVKGVPSSGLLWGISSGKLAPTGSSDKLVQAYCYRICLTSDPDNMIPITRPENYDPDRYELLVRLIDAQPEQRTLANFYNIWSPMPNNKTDINNRSGFSTDMIGANHSYLEANWEERQQIIKEHTDYTKGLLYFWGHDERIPIQMREEMRSWGYPKDEYVDNGHWTPQLYIREGRRLIGDYVATQSDCEGRTTPKDGIALAAYTMDSHNCQRIVIHKEGVPMVKNEGNVEIYIDAPYPISYRSITPKKSECGNLLVPVCVSSSHIAFGSIRMEPVFMVLGQVSAIAACLAIDNDVEMIQDLDYREINRIMETNPYLDDSTPEITVDDKDDGVIFSKNWQCRCGGGYGPTLLELPAGNNVEKAIFPFSVEIAGDYSVYSYQNLGDSQLASVTDFEIKSGDKSYKTFFDRRGKSALGQTTTEWIKIGTYHFDIGKGFVAIMNRAGSDGPTRADAVLLIKE